MKIRTCFHRIAVLLSLVLSSGYAKAIDPDQHFFKALGAPAHPKTSAVWNHFHDTEALANILDQLQTHFPDLARLYSLGLSDEGRQLWCLEVTDRRIGNPQRKPGMLIDGNIHGNEVQAGEVVAYTAWYLCESHETNPQVQDLLDRFVFYLIPTINPDGRDFWLHAPNNAHSSRSGKQPKDNDRDGLIDEDGSDDLNGDGHISLMRMRDPNGRWKKHPDFPDRLMVRAADDERGEYTILGDEGIDNDGDGRINEDGPGGYDPNRNWGFDWQPEYIQGGAHDFPFSLPNTQAVAQFVIGHPNIVSMQSYHNYGGMILREPGREGGEMQPEDDRVLRSIAGKGETMLPFYRSMVVGADLYTVWGGETGWFYGARGIYGFVNELWTSKNMFHYDRTDKTSEVEFDKFLLLNDAFIPWRDYQHPTYGKIEIGGWKKEFGRLPPSFMLEEECHRNSAFTLYHASQMPAVEFGEITTQSIGDRVYKVRVELRNNGMIPTRSAQDVKHQINPPDVVTIQGGELKVISAGHVTDRYFNKVEPVKIRPERIEVDTIPGLDSVWIQFVVAGKGTAKIKLDSTRGGLIEKTVVMK